MGETYFMKAEIRYQYELFVNNPENNVMHKMAVRGGIFRRRSQGQMILRTITNRKQINR